MNNDYEPLISYEPHDPHAHASLAENDASPKASAQQAYPQFCEPSGPCAEELPPCASDARDTLTAYAEINAGFATFGIEYKREW